MSRHKTNYRMALALAIINLLAGAPVYMYRGTKESAVADMVAMLYAAATMWVGAAAVIIWLILAIILYRRAKYREFEDLAPTRAAQVKWLMACILAGVTSLVFPLPHILGGMFGLNVFFSAVQVLMPMAVMLLAGWVFLALILWLTYPRVRADGGTT